MQKIRIQKLFQSIFFSKPLESLFLFFKFDLLLFLFNSFNIEKLI